MGLTISQLGQVSPRSKIYGSGSRSRNVTFEGDQMPAVHASLEYLQKLEKYNDEKPYWCFQQPHEGFDPNVQRLDNLEFEQHPGIFIRDIRECKIDADIDDCGFQVLSHESRFTRFEKASDFKEYKAETEWLLKRDMNAVYVNTYDWRLRKNVPFHRQEMDLNDPLVAEGPARGVHNDITYDSGPTVINKYMSQEDISKFIQPGFRFRIVNTWRTLIPILEDRPLALCDSRSVDPADLIAADRIIPNNIGEVYYLTYNPNHKWYWLEKQTPSEPYAFVMYDTKSGNHARFCPHVSFVNPRAPKDTTPRESIETRSIVITKE